MKHLCGCFHSQSFSWSVIQSVLIHSNFLLSDRGHGSFLWNILAKQTVEVFMAAAFPAGKWSGKLGSALKLFINIGMPCKPLPLSKVSVLTRAAKGWSLSTMAALTNADVCWSPCLNLCCKIRAWDILSLLRQYANHK
jgi:hypothetical protein